MAFSGPYFPSVHLLPLSLPTLGKGLTPLKHPQFLSLSLRFYSFGILYLFSFLPDFHILLSLPPTPLGDQTAGSQWATRISAAFPRQLRPAALISLITNNSSVGLPKNLKTQEACGSSPGRGGGGMAAYELLMDSICRRFKGN